MDFSLFTYFLQIQPHRFVQQQTVFRPRATRFAFSGRRAFLLLPGFFAFAFAFFTGLARFGFLALRPTAFGVKARRINQTAAKAGHGKKNVHKRIRANQAVRIVIHRSDHGAKGGADADIRPATCQKAKNSRAAEKQGEL